MTLYPYLGDGIEGEGEMNLYPYLGDGIEGEGDMTLTTNSCDLSSLTTGYHPEICRLQSSTG